MVPETSSGSQPAWWSWRSAQYDPAPRSPLCSAPLVRRARRRRLLRQEAAAAINQIGSGVVDLFAGDHRRTCSSVGHQSPAANPPQLSRSRWAACTRRRGEEGRNRGEGGRADGEGKRAERRCASARLKVHDGDETVRKYRRAQFAPFSTSFFSPPPPPSRTDMQRSWAGLHAGGSAVCSASLSACYTWLLPVMTVTLQ